jgi:Nif-specific regulatory protein
LANGPLAEPEDLALSYLQVPGQSANTLSVNTLSVNTNSTDASMTDATMTMHPTEYQEKTIEAMEQQHIEATLEHTGGQKNRAAAILGIERSTLDRKLKKFQGS